MCHVRASITMPSVSVWTRRTWSIASYRSTPMSSNSSTPRQVWISRKPGFYNTAWKRVYTSYFNHLRENRAEFCLEIRMLALCALWIYFILCHSLLIFKLCKMCDNQYSCGMILQSIYANIQFVHITIWRRPVCRMCGAKPIHDPVLNYCHLNL